MAEGKYEQFITLPATASASDFPNNKLGRYSVKLQERLRLTGKRYQVALVELLYSNTWNTVTIGLAQVRNTVTGRITPVNIYPGRPRNMATLLGRLHEAFSTLNLEKSFSIHHSGYNNVVTLICHDAKYSIRFDSGLANIFKLTANHWYARGSHKGFGGADLDVSCRMLFVYSDLAADRPVGDVSAPLLRVVPVKGARNADVATEFTQPQYVEARQVDTDVVSVLIATEQGDVVPFRSGRVTLTLHIREV